MIPDFVNEALEQVFTDTTVDMLDQQAVITHLDLVYQEAADWLRANPELYSTALDELNYRMNGDEE